MCVRACVFPGRLLNPLLTLIDLKMRTGVTRSTDFGNVVGANPVISECIELHLLSSVVIMLFILWYLQEGTKAADSVFRRLQTKAFTNRIKLLFEYVRKNLITSAIWPPQSWSVYGLSIRNNNDVEDWSNSGRLHMSFYIILITLLLEEPILVHM